jgi:hypothetical protein
MSTLPADCAPAILAFAELFSKRVFGYVQTLLLGAILAPAQRTVTACLRVMGLASLKQFQNYHRVLSRAQWSAHQGSRILLRLVVSAFVPTGPIILGIDDTLERRRGKKIAPKGVYRDAVRSSHGHFVKATGLRWLSVMLLVNVPWAVRRWALPVLTMLAPSERYHQQKGRPHKKLTDWARQAILQIHRWLPDRQLIVVADSGFAALDLLAAVASSATVITRLRMDAALYEPAPTRTAGQIGRPRKRGQRLPKLEDIAADRSKRWRRLSIRWYGQDNRHVDVKSGTALWSHVGKPAVPIRWVIVRDPKGTFPTQAFLSTDRRLTPAEILGIYVHRWQMEVTFEEARQHLGVESQRQWSDRAIARTTPVLLGLYSLVTLIAMRIDNGSGLLKRTAAWYVKEQYCFSDAVASVRNHIWLADLFVRSPHKVDLLKIPRAFIERCISTLCYAS